MFSESEGPLQASLGTVGGFISEEAGDFTVDRNRFSSGNGEAGLGAEVGAVATGSGVGQVGATLDVPAEITSGAFDTDVDVSAVAAVLAVLVPTGVVFNV